MNIGKWIKRQLRKWLISKVVGTGTVSDSNRPPSGYLWDRLAEAKTKKELDELDRYAEAQGYVQDGQLRVAIAKKRSTL